MKFKVEDLLNELHKIYIDGHRIVELNLIDNDDSDDVDFLALSVPIIDDDDFFEVDCDYDSIDSISEDDDYFNTNSSFKFTDITIEALTWLYDYIKESDKSDDSYYSTKERLNMMIYLIAHLSCGYSNPNSKEISLILTGLENYRLYLLKNDFYDKDIKRKTLSQIDKELKSIKKIAKSFGFKFKTTNQ